MILQPQHSHEQITNNIIVPSPSNNNHSQATSQAQSPSKQEAPSYPPILQHILSNSTSLLTDKRVKQIHSKIQHIQQKVHISFSNGLAEYLGHLKPNIEKQSHEVIAQIIDIQNWLAANKIQSGVTTLKEKADIKDLGSNIKQKIADMKKSIMSISSIQKKASAQFQNILEFRKQHYWAHQTEKGKKIKSFVSKMKRIHSQQKKRQEKQLGERQQRLKNELQNQKKLSEQKRRQIYKKQLEKQALWRMQRSKNLEQERKKKEKVQELLQKFNADKPFYMRKQEQYTKKVLQPQQEERERILQEIRSQHQPIDQEQLDQHLQKYQEYKEVLLDEKRKKREQEDQMNSKLEQGLQQLYHCKFHKEIQPRFYNSQKEIVVEKTKKINEYKKLVLENYKPAIDPLKRSKLKQQILDLEIRENKKKRKVIKQDGSVVLEDRPEFNARRIGVQYLEELKEGNEGKPRKKEDRSTSMMELSENSKVKRIDYLRENKPNLKYKKTLGQWKKVVADGTYSPRQKYESIMQQAMVLQEKAHQKEEQMRSYKKGEKAMELKQQMDRLYMQSVAAKMVVLKDVILKQ